MKNVFSTAPPPSSPPPPIKHSLNKQKYKKSNDKKK